MLDSTESHQEEMEKESVFSLIWFVPLLTFLITGWLIYSDYVNSGTIITLQLNSGEQIVAGKTSVKYLGVEVGKVIDVNINEEKPTIIDVSVRLRKRASVLAVVGTKFWLVKPVLSLKKISGLETLVSGQYIAVKPPVADKKVLIKMDKKFIFVCHERPPEEDYKRQGKVINFSSSHKGGVQVDSGVYYKDIKIGHILEYKLNQNSGLVNFSAIIYTQYENLLNSPHFLSRIPISSLDLNSQGVNFQIKDMEIFLHGGVELHIFSQDFNKLAQKDSYLYDSKNEVEEAFYKFTDSKIITLYTDNPGKLSAGAPVYLKKVKVGEVKELKLSKDGENVFIQAVIYGNYRKFIKNSSIFWIRSGVDVQLKGRSLKIDTAPVRTLLNGGIEFMNPTIKLKKENRRIRGYKIYESRGSVDTFLQSQRPGRRVILHSSYARSLSTGDPVYYRQVKVGRIEWTKLSLNAQHVLIQIFIEPNYAHLLYKKAKFWNVGVIDTQFNLFGIKIKTGSLESMIKGGVAFAVPSEGKGRKARNGDTFYLYEKPDKEWIKWSPKL